ncbi:MAG: hypothetical protein NVV74_04240 [Magnetospirillum sp.]|nr:hypothetical protein [Magnetospirillum sp.]
MPQDGRLVIVLTEHMVVVGLLYSILAAIIYGFSGVLLASFSIVPVIGMYLFINKYRINSPHAHRFTKTDSQVLLAKQRRLLVVAGLLALIVYAPISYMVSKGVGREWAKVVHGAVFLLVSLSFMAGWGHVKLRRHDLGVALLLAGSGMAIAVIIYVLCQANGIPFPLAASRHSGEAWLHGFVVACVALVMSLSAIYVGAWSAQSLAVLLNTIEEIAPAITRMVPVVFVICAGIVVLNLVFASAYMQFHGWSVPQGAQLKPDDYSDHVFLAFYIIFGGASDNLMMGGPPRRMLIIVHLMVFVFWLASFLQLMLARVSDGASSRLPVVAAPVRRSRSRKPGTKLRVKAASAGAKDGDQQPPVPG